MSFVLTGFEGIGLLSRTKYISGSATHTSQHLQSLLLKIEYRGASGEQLRHLHRR